MLLKDKVVVVTGSTRGIGKGVALQCLKEGAKVVGSGTNKKLVEELPTEFKKLGYEIDYVVCDVTKQEDVHNLMEYTYRKYGKIDCLVANAGITDVQKFENMTPERFDHLLSINLRGEYLADYEVYPYLRKNGGGKIVNVGSDCSYQGWANMPSYSAAKFGVRGMTQALAKELGEYNITVNCICPGIIDTDIWIDGDKMTTAITGEEQGSSWKKTVATIPMKRPGTPEDIGKGVVLLLSEYADYITGNSLMVGGGSQMN